jgi:hypothetical protein
MEVIKYSQFQVENIVPSEPQEKIFGKGAGGGVQYTSMPLKYKTEENTLRNILLELPEFESSGIKRFVNNDSESLSIGLKLYMTKKEHLEFYELWKKILDKIRNIIVEKQKELKIKKKVKQNNVAEIVRDPISLFKGEETEEESEKGNDEKINEKESNDDQNPPKYFNLKLYTENRFLPTRFIAVGRNKKITDIPVKSLENRRFTVIPTINISYIYSNSVNIALIVRISSGIITSINEPTSYAISTKTIEEVASRMTPEMEQRIASIAVNEEFEDDKDERNERNEQSERSERDERSEQNQQTEGFIENL